MLCFYIEIVGKFKYLNLCSYDVKIKSMVEIV